MNSNPHEDVAVRTIDGLTPSQLKVAEDYLALRKDADATPAVAAALVTAIQTHELANAVRDVTGLLRQYARDPARAVSWVRQFQMIMKNIDDVEAVVEKEHADELFEQTLKTMKDQLDNV